MAGPVDYSRPKRPLTEPAVRGGSLETTRVRRSKPDGRQAGLAGQVLVRGLVKVHLALVGF